MMIVLLGFLALAIDGGRYYQMRRVNQNAADSAARAAILYFSQQSSPTISGTWNAIVASITRNGILGANGITDAMTILPNGQKPVQAWFVDDSGNVVTEFNRDTSGTIPNTAHAIKVTTHIRYRTFFASVTGQLYLPTEATALARETVVAKMPVNFPYGMYIAGPACNDASHWAAAVFNTQNITFNGDIWINGTLAWDYNNQNADMKNGHWTVNGPVMVDSTNNDGLDDATAWEHNALNSSTANGGVSGDNSNPNIATSGWNNFGTWTAPNNSQIGSTWPYLAQPYTDQWPSWLYEDHYDTSFAHNPLAASDFKKPDGALYKAYLKFGWKDYNGSSNSYQYGYTADQWFHTVTLTSSDPHQNWLTFKSAYDTATPTKDGIYYLAGGDISLDGNMGSGTHVTIASTGRIYVPATSNNFNWTDAGFTAAGISLMAGGTPPNANGNTNPAAGPIGSPCATSPYDWVLMLNGNQPQVTGYLYVPNGQFEMNANFASGNNKAIAAAILAYSWRNGTQVHLPTDTTFGSYSTQAQNVQYANNPQAVPLPVICLVNGSP